MDIELTDVSYRYQKNSPLEIRALEKINAFFSSGSYTAIIGHTGSGKSTLLQLLNALLIPTAGRVAIGSQVIVAGKKYRRLQHVREKVGIVFQFPEAQLFEETVEKDICFGPLNFGVSLREAKERARKTITAVGLTESILKKSPFELSGGQMRRVAIAGVLAMNPEVLVLDEPTAGLDPHAKIEIMEMFHHLHEEKKLTTILVTHSMEDAARYAEALVIMKNGEINRVGKTRELFGEAIRNPELGLSLPETIHFQVNFEQKFGCDLGKVCLTTEELVVAISNFLREGSLA